LKHYFYKKYTAVNLFKKIEDIKAGKGKAALCIIIQTKGSTPRKVGTKMLVYEDGSIFGTIGGGNLEQKVIAQAIVQMNLKKPDTFKYNLVKDLEMCCGGMVAVYIEPIMKTNTLYIFGAGHTGEALAKMASFLNFEVTLLDDRKEYLDKVEIENITKELIDFNTDLDRFKTNPNTYIVVMTYSHPVDRQILSHYVDEDLAYLGMIGSKRKIVVAKKMLQDEKYASREQVNKIDMPIGLSIGAIEPAEIAVAILAKLIEVKNGTE
jgi:xanthine dehydrogenase accessory factor